MAVKNSSFIEGKNVKELYHTPHYSVNKVKKKKGKKVAVKLLKVLRNGMY